MLLLKRHLLTNGTILLHSDVRNVSYNSITPSLSFHAADSLQSGDYLERVTPDLGNLIWSKVTERTMDSLMSL